MATADLKLIYGGGGSFRPTFASGRQEIAAASSGILLTLTPPASKKVRLTGLLCSVTAHTEANISISCDGSPVITNLTLVNTAPGGTGVNTFIVGFSTATNAGQGVGVVRYLEGISSIVISKTSGSTVNPIGYSYEYGD